MIEYITPVSVDRFGSYPGRKLGDRFEQMHEGRVWRVEIVGTAREQPYGAILRDAHFQQVEGPVNRAWLPVLNLKPDGRYGFGH